MKRFQRPINEYTGSQELLYRDKYQQDSQSVPKIAISSSKMDGDFNYLVDAVNTLDEDIKSVVHSGISNQSISAEHIADYAVVASKIANNAVGSKALQEGSVTNAKIADLSVTTPKIANNSVTKDKMASASVGTDELIDGAITKDKLASDAISDSVPVGTIAQFSAQTLPTGWVLCGGSTVSKNTYPQLVKFLTGSDTTLEATLPTLEEFNGVKFAIKAYSDVAELATIDFASLTQDVVNNAAELQNKASKYAEAIAIAEINADGSIAYSKGINYVSKIATGKNMIYLDDALQGKQFDCIMAVDDWVIALYDKDYTLGKILINTVKIANASYFDAGFTIIVLERKGA